MLVVGPRLDFVEEPYVETLTYQVGQQRSEYKSGREVQDSRKCLMDFSRKLCRLGSSGRQVEQTHAHHDDDNDADTKAQKNRLAGGSPPVLLAQQIRCKENAGVEDHPETGFQPHYHGELRALEVGQENSQYNRSRQTKSTEQPVHEQRHGKIQRQCE